MGPLSQTREHYPPTEPSEETIDQAIEVARDWPRVEPGSVSDLFETLHEALRCPQGHRVLQELPAPPLSWQDTAWHGTRVNIIGDSVFWLASNAKGAHNMLSMALRAELNPEFELGREDVLCAKGAFEIAVRLAQNVCVASERSHAHIGSLIELSALVDSIADDSIDEACVCCWQGNDLFRLYYKKPEIEARLKEWALEKPASSFSVIVDMPLSVTYPLDLIARSLRKYKRPIFLPPVQSRIWNIRPESMYDRLSSQAADIVENHHVPVCDLSTIFSELGKRDSWHFSADSNTAKKLAGVLGCLVRMARGMDWLRSYAFAKEFGREPQLWKERAVPLEHFDSIVQRAQAVWNQPSSKDSARDPAVRPPAMQAFMPPPPQDPLQAIMDVDYVPPPPDHPPPPDLPRPPVGTTPLDSFRLLDPAPPSDPPPAKEPASSSKDAPWGAPQRV